MECKGIDTIRGLVGEPPHEISCPMELVALEQGLLQAWNKVFIAVLPYCYKCREPLVWHSPPDDDVLFHCPKCERRWIKDELWTATK
jgi:hypothetical protein